MRSLLIMRHAEARPAGPNLRDVDRPLTEPGASYARSVGESLTARGIAPQRVICSAAVRARETADALVAGAGYQLEPEALQPLYNAPGEQLLAAVRELPDEAEQVLLVAHVPGVAQLVNLLVTEHIDLALVFQAGTLAEVVLEIDEWDEADYGTGALRLLLPP